MASDLYGYGHPGPALGPGVRKENFSGLQLQPLVAYRVALLLRNLDLDHV